MASPTWRRIDWLADAHWLHAERARAWLTVLVLISVPTAAYMLAMEHGGGLRRHVVVRGTDFLSFWSASYVALHQGPAAAYDVAQLVAAEHAVYRAIDSTSWYAFFYPPTFLLLCLPLALVPYLVAFGLWIVAGLVLLVPALRRLLPARWAVVPMVCSPAVVVNLLGGQNGFLTAACYAWGTALLERRPFLAGAAFGLLAFKPHLAIAIPAGLLAARRLRAVAGAACSSIGFCLLSWAALGRTTWIDFHRMSALATDTLVHGYVPPWKMSSIFTAVRLLGGNVLVAAGVQGVQAAVALALLVAVTWRRPGARIEGAAIATCSMLCTPFLLNYDLNILAVPLCVLAADAQVTGWRRWEKVVCLLVYMLPLVGAALGSEYHAPSVPVGVWLLYAVVLHRGLSQRGSAP